ncbi:ligand-binding sensor domain-containing diguanylate cyclase [Solimonas marina]|uniref:diguanylate cyclase n=1 Tax=Solimonas marina TaxID=2714601 RepID=A0A969WAI1_9GAMM|nr:ligand-binding sensor domain-containing diguanylate cyclase [Solimonas marina]NKF23801.1 diguanylate cyclase [Solimonas marina]
MRHLRALLPVAVWLSGLLLSGAPPSAFADARWSTLAQTVFHNYGREQGLPHPAVTALAQDRQGFLWIGTQGGLARWDGYRFRAYNSDAKQPYSLPDDWIQTLHVDAAGTLWVGGSAGGLARYDATLDRFDPITLGAPARRIHIGALADDGHGGLWIGTDRGLRHLDAAHRLTPAPSLPQTASVQALLRTADGRLWVGTVNGLWWRDAASPGAWRPVALGGDDNASVSVLHADTDGRIWVGTRDRGLFVIGADADSAQPFGGRSALSDSAISSICNAPDGIWVGLRGGGIIAIDTRSNAIRAIRHDRALANSLAHDDVWALLRDRAGSIWVGVTGGLSYHPNDTGLISTVYGAALRPGGLSAADVQAVLGTDDGQVWLGYLDGGADIVDPESGRVRALHPDARHPATALPAETVFAMAEGPQQRVYLGTQRGLYVADRDGSRLHRLTLPGRDPQSAVGALAFDAGVLWVGGERDGVWGYTIDTADGGADQLVMHTAGATALSDPGIWAIRRGVGNDLWIGTRDGLARLDLASHALERIDFDPKDAAGLPARFVTCLLLDRRHRLWVGTFGGGIAVMTGRDRQGRPRFRHFGLQDGLPHLNVDSLQMDGDGTLWAGTDDGLARIDPDTLAVRAVRRASGAALVDYFAGAAGTDRAGEALFGAIGGLTVVRPGVLPVWSFQAPIAITDLRVSGHSVPAGLFNDSAAHPPLTIAPHDKHLSVEFAALDFSSPTRNRYAYRLEGLDDEWTLTDAGHRLAVYANLAPGDYRLQIRGSNRAGTWNPQVLTLPLRVLPAWYQRWWFRALAVLLVVALLAVIVRQRTAYLRRRQRQLERQIAERTADLQAAHDRLVQLATTDPLTGCANRRHFVERANELIALSRRHGTPLSMAIIDLDGFKHLNDTYGHPAGDTTLTQVGRTILKRLRGTDAAGRIGGEEFAVLMPHTDQGGAARLTEALRIAVADLSVDSGGARLCTTASIGIATLRAGESFDELYARADAALYEAKQRGRNRIALAP